MSFEISALDHRPFAQFFDMSEGELAAHLAVRCVADEKPGFPCRVSLKDAEVGDELILVNLVHQDGASPYRASHAVYVRRGVEQAQPAVGEVPEVLLPRTLSLRAFDAKAMIVTAELAEGRDLGPALDKLLATPNVEYVHIHYAKYGCYAARADRA